MITTQDASFGAPVLSASTGGQPIIEDPTWTPPASTLTRLTERPIDPPEPESEVSPSQKFTDGEIVGIIIASWFGAVLLFSLAVFCICAICGGFVFHS